MSGAGKQLMSTMIAWRGIQEGEPNAEEKARLTFGAAVSTLPHLLPRMFVRYDAGRVRHDKRSTSGFGVSCSRTTGIDASRI